MPLIGFEFMKSGTLLGHQLVRSEKWSGIRISEPQVRYMQQKEGQRTIHLKCKMIIKFFGFPIFFMRQLTSFSCFMLLQRTQIQAFQEYIWYKELNCVIAHTIIQSPNLKYKQQIHSSKNNLSCRKQIPKNDINPKSAVFLINNWPFGIYNLLKMQN